MFWLWQSAERAQTEAEASRASALNATMTSIGRLGGFLNDGTLSARNAERLLEGAKVTLDDLAKADNQSLEISKIEILFLLNFSDVRVALGDHDDALKRAERAVAISEKLLNRYPDNKELKRNIYASRFRIGDEKARTGNNQDAEAQYKIALKIARELASSDPGNADRQRNVAFVLNKIADLNKIRRDYKTAMDQYTEGLKIAEAVAEKFPGDIATQKTRIAQLLSERNQPGDAQAAYAQYREALAIQTDLLSKSPDDATLLSNAALTHRRIGGLLKGRPGEAQAEYEAAVANRKKLFESDPGNVLWRTGLIADYLLLGDTLSQLKDFRGAAQNYNAAIQVQEGLVRKDPANVDWQRQLAVAHLKRGDASIARLEEIPSESSRLISSALTRYRTAENIFQKIVSDPKAGATRFSNLFDVRFKIGDALVRQHEYKAALDAYQSASAAAAQAAATGRVGDWQSRLSVALERAGDSLARKATENPAANELDSKDEPAALAYYQRALEALEAATGLEPDNEDFYVRKAALKGKLEDQRSAAR